MDAGSESLLAELHSTDENGGAPGEKLPNATLTARLVQFDAFRPSSVPDGQFQTPSDCTQRRDNVVPIIVACGLSGMFVVLLTAYMVARSNTSQVIYTLIL